MQNDILADLVQGLVQVQGKGRLVRVIVLRMRMFTELPLTRREPELPAN